MAKKRSKQLPKPAYPKKQRTQKQSGGDETSKQRDTSLVHQPDNVQRAIPKQIPWPDPIVSTQSSEERDRYRFLNPYNFVRYLPEPEIPQGNSDAQLLGRCPPPPHDRYIGLTGRISCTLKAVTPLFVSDAHDIIVHKEGEKEHRSYRFFQYDGKDAIPATSLRGMIRSVFEAVTNSCFSIFDGERQLEFREQPEYGNRVKGNAGIVRRLASPATDEHPAINGEIELCQVGKVGAYYEGRETWKNVLGQKSKGKSWKCRDRVVARAKKRQQDWIVFEIGTTKEQLQPLRTDEEGNHIEEYVEGWLKITGKGKDTNKRSETLFLDPKIHQGKGVLSFSYQLQSEYNMVLDNQLKQGDLPEEIQPKALSERDLVWVETTNQDNQLSVQRIVRVQVPRISYKKKIGDLLSDNNFKHICHCSDYNTLCPACRIFGWVHENAKNLDISRRVAYAGRVRFSHATLTDDGDKGVYDSELPLSILSSPKPTTTLFYLQKAGDEPWTEEERKLSEKINLLGYDGPNMLRGRKFYRHHGNQLNRQEYERAERIRNNQNRSVRGVRTPGNVFGFTIDFHNLAPVELGALLWVLHLSNEQCYHRLGYAKPLGFGSVRVNVDEVQVLDLTKRYQSLNSCAGWKRVDTIQRGEWIYRFEQAMQACYGCSLEQLDNIRDLFALLQEPDASLPKHIHYPRTGEIPDPEGENFEWFVENKRKSKKVREAGPNHTLEIAAEEKDGLPLLQKKS